MPITLAFDVYGTLINTHGVMTALSPLVGDQAALFSNTWRDKQLEYSFRRGLMQSYQPFGVCTRQALDYTCAFLKTPLTEQEKAHLLDVYRALPAFEEVTVGLSQLAVAGFRLFAFSNGTADAVNTLLSTAGIRDYFEGVVSVDELHSFKPNPAVYQHFLTKVGATANNTWLISSNSFDVIGAVSAGMKAAWLRRSPEAVFDPWGIEPSAIIADLHALPAVLASSK